MHRQLLSLLLAALPLFAQEPKPSFEVVSVRPDSMTLVTLPNGLRVFGGSQGGPGTSDPERLFMSHVALVDVVTRAYGVRLYQVSGPDWIGTTRYDISAKIPPGATKEQFNLMLQDMLEQRFGLKLHQETKDFKAYNLVEAKGGLKLKGAVSTDACAAGARPVNGTCPSGAVFISGIARSVGDKPPQMSTSPAEGGFILRGISATMTTLAGMIEARLRGPLLIDKTGLTEHYDIRLEFANPDVGTQGDFAFADLFSALEKEIGLKLEPTTVSRDTLVIDKIEKPTEN